MEISQYDNLPHVSQHHIFIVEKKNLSVDFDKSHNKPTALILSSLNLLPNQTIFSEQELGRIPALFTDLKETENKKRPLRDAHLQMQTGIKISSLSVGIQNWYKTCTLCTLYFTP